MGAGGLTGGGAGIGGMIAPPPANGTPRAAPFGISAFGFALTFGFAVAFALDIAALRAALILSASCLAVSETLVLNIKTYQSFSSIQSMFMCVSVRAIILICWPLMILMICSRCVIRLIPLQFHVAILKLLPYLICVRPLSDFVFLSSAVSTCSCLLPVSP